jgi:hypothetical protein
MKRHLYALMKCPDLLVDLFGPSNSDTWLLTIRIDYRPGEKKKRKDKVNHSSVRL